MLRRRRGERGGDECSELRERFFFCIVVWCPSLSKTESRTVVPFLPNLTCPEFIVAVGVGVHLSDCLKEAGLGTRCHRDILRAADDAKRIDGVIVLLVPKLVPRETLAVALSKACYGWRRLSGAVLLLLSPILT